MCAGFGIRSREQVEQLRGHVAGVIVGSALVEVMENGQDAAQFLRSLRPRRRLTRRLQHKLPGYAMLAVLIGGLSMVSPFSIDTFFPAFHAMERALHVDALAAAAGDHGVHGAVRLRVAGARAAVRRHRPPPRDDLGHGAVYRGLDRLHAGA